MCLAEASVQKEMAPAAGRDQRRAEPKVSLPSPPVSKTQTALALPVPAMNVVPGVAADDVGVAVAVPSIAAVSVSRQVHKQVPSPR